MTTTPTIVAQFMSSAFMGSMGPGAGLGTMISASNSFMDLHPNDPAQAQSRVVGELYERCVHVPGMKDVYDSTLKPTAPAGNHRQKQTLFQERARPVMSERLRELAEKVEKGEAGVPVFRKKGDVIPPGFRAKELRRLIDSGTAATEDVRRFVAAVEENLEANIKDIEDIERKLKKSAGAFIFPGIFFMSSSMISFAWLPNKTSLIGILPFLLGADIYISNSPGNEICSAMGMNFLNFAGRIRKRKKEMERLLAEYRREFGHPDWASVWAGSLPATSVPAPAAATSFPSPSTGGGRGEGGVGPPSPLSPPIEGGERGITIPAPPPPPPSITAETGEHFTPRTERSSVKGLARLDGLEDQNAVKAWMKGIADGVRVDIERQRQKLPTATAIHSAFIGGEGTGRETYAEVYAEVLGDAGRFGKNAPRFTVIDMQSLEGDPKKSTADRLSEALMKSPLGVIMIRNAGLLMSAGPAFAVVLPSSGPTDAVGALIHRMKAEDRQHDIVLADDAKSMEALFRAVPELAKYIVNENRVRFEDYDGPQLLRIMDELARKGGLSLSDEARTKAMMRLKGKKGGIGIARDLLDEARTKQSARIAEVMAEGRTPTKDDLSSLVSADFGTEMGARASEAIERLNAMTGLKGAKDSIRGIVDLLEENKRKEELGVSVVRPSLHALFLGSQGTGKTTVADIFGLALRDLGCLSKGHLVKTTPAALVGDVVGAAERNVAAKFAEARGGILLVDEAHTFATSDLPFGKKALETLVPLMENHRDDTLVIFAGYRDKMEAIFKIDPGLRGRFKLVIEFDDYSDEDLGKIFGQMAKVAGLEFSDGVIEAAVGVLSRERGGKDFAYARSVRNLFERAIVRQGERHAKERSAGAVHGANELRELRVEDIVGPDAPKPFDIHKILDKYVGIEGVKAAIEEYLDVIEMARARGKDPRKAFEPGFAMVGPKGTGKTSVAKDLGKIFQSLGFIPSDKVVVVNAMDLIAGFQGQTAGKTREILERALGGVLFIDEIGGLARMAGQYGMEAVNVLLTFLEENRGRLVVAVAGYEDEVNAFFALDEGFSSRLPNRLYFDPFTVDQAIVLFERQLAAEDFILAGDAGAELREQIGLLANAPAWSSGRDVRTLAGTVQRKQAVWWRSHREHNSSIVPAEVIQTAVAEMIAKKIAENRARPRTTPATAPAATDSAEARKAPVRATAGTAGAPPAARTAVDTTVAHRAEHIAMELGLDPAAMMSAAQDPASELVKKLAEEMGVSPEEASAKLVAELQAIAEAIASQPKQKGFICMHCGNSNPDCPYKSLPDEEKQKHNAWRDGGE